MSLTDYLKPRNCGEQTRKLVVRIAETVERLKSDGVTRVDRDVLTSRLQLTWSEPEKPAGPDQSATLWRKARARRTYIDIQEKDDHLFFAVVLAIPPTECAKTRFDNILHHLTRLDSYDRFQLTLDHDIKTFLESTAAEKGFSGNRHFLRFMQTMFPQEEERNASQGSGQYYSFSFVTQEMIDEIPEPFRTGVKTCILRRREERSGGLAVTNCLSMSVPEQPEEDVYLTIRMGYQHGWRIFHQLGFGVFGGTTVEDEVADRIRAG